MRKPILSTLAAAGIALSSAAGAAERGVSDDEIVLGSFTPLSGPAAIWGVASMNAARLRFEEANADGGVHGRKIRLIVEDSQYQVPLAIQAANKLVNRDEVLAIFAALGTPINLAVEQRLYSQNVPNLFPFAAASVLYDNQNRLKFSWGSTYRDQVLAAVEYFTTEKGRKRICVMYQDTDYGEEVLQAATDAAAEHGAEIVAKAGHVPTATEFVGAMTAFKNADCGLIVFGTIIRDTIIGYATARKLGIAADIVANTASLDGIIASAEGGITEGLYAMGNMRVVYSDTAEGRAADFFKNYAEAYGSDPSVAAMLGYLSADLVVTGLENAGRDLTVDSLISGLERIVDFEDMTGNPPVSYSADNHSGYPRTLVLSQVRNGRWVEIGR